MNASLPLVEDYSQIIATKQIKDWNDLITKTMEDREKEK